MNLSLSQHQNLRRSLIGAWLCAGVVACGGPEEPSAREVARGAVKAVINPVIAAQFPGVPTDIAVDCVIDNASGQEIVEIANAALLGNTTDTLYVVTPILTRASTVQCLAAKTLGQ